MSRRGRKKEEAETSAVEERSETAPVKEEGPSPAASGSMLSNRKVLYAVILIAIVAIAAWRLSTFTLPTSSDLTGQIVQQGGDDIGKGAAGAKVVDFLQSRLEISYPGITVELVDVQDAQEVPDTYEVNVKITYQGQAQDAPYYVTRDGNYMFSGVVDLNEQLPEAQPAEDTGGVGAGTPSNPALLTFIDSGEEICYEDGKPAIFLFSTTWCPHCSWVSDTFESVAKEYMDAGKIVAYHYEIDINDDTLTEEAEGTIPPEHMAIYSKFNPRGSIPTFVFGCKYYRVGNGYEAAQDIAAEEAEFRAAIEDLLAA